MGKGFFVSKPGKDFDWKGFQKHVGYSDEEMAALKNDPKKSAYVQKICSPDMQGKYLVAEVVTSHGCPAGMQPGDRIYFKGLSLLEPKKGDAWCPYIANVNWFTSNARGYFTQDLDLNSFYCNYSGCMDVGPDNGVGRVAYKVFVVDESELDK